MIYDYYKIIFSTKDKKREATKVNETPNGSQNVLQKFMKIFCEVSAAGCDTNSCFMQLGQNFQIKRMLTWKI